MSRASVAGPQETYTIFCGDILMIEAMTLGSHPVRGGSRTSVSNFSPERASATSSADPEWPVILFSSFSYALISRYFEACGHSSTAVTSFPTSERNAVRVPAPE